MKKAIWILWPSFIVGGIGTVLAFTAIDPADLDLSRKAAYTFGFFFLWALGAGSSAFTCFLQQRRDEVNRCPLTPVERPVGCPKRQDTDASC